MHRFFSEEVNIKESTVRLSGGDAHHAAQVLRLSVGDLIMVGTGNRDYTCRITSISPEEVLGTIEDISGNAAELPVEITLYQGFPKGDKLELIIQKAVELGAASIVPVWMTRSVVKMDQAKAEKRRLRYQAISESAAKQSGRGVIPEVGTFLSMKEAVKAAEKHDLILLPYENAKGMRYTKDVLKKLEKGAKEKTIRSVGIFIGPEGGFEESEIDALRKIGAEVITLGHRILRTETAGMMLLSVLGFLLDRDAD
ncbi:MAG: 16S rRNA (uracil(1498)-N(3))-methyltransferase [Eubacterium sp.]|nr:16S rRNA (uracil(1498)-N(3))-methyltransferase [Eubacterium sp.]